MEEERIVVMGDHSKNRMANGYDLTQGPILWELFCFAIPLLLGNLFQQLYNTADFMIVGHFCGNTAQAAVSSTVSLMNLLISATQGFAVGAGVIISMNYGAGKLEKMRKAAYTSITIGLIAGVIVMVIGFLFSRSILIWMQTPEQVLKESAAYFRILSIGLFFMVLYNVGNGLFRAIGDNRSPLIFLIVSVVCNIVLDLVFVAVFRLGVRGAATATVLAQGISVVFEYRSLFSSQCMYHLHFREIKIDREQLLPILRNAFPSGAQNCIVSFSNVVVQSYVNQFGELAMAGFGAYNKLGSFAVLPAMSISLSLTTFVSQNMGAEAYDRAKRCVWYGLGIVTVITGLFGAAITLLAEPSIALFNPDPQVIAYGAGMARRVAPFLILPGLSHGIAGALRGFGQAKIPMILLLVTWCFMRVAWIAGLNVFVHDIRVVYWAYPVTWVASTVLLGWAYRRQEKRIVPHP